MKSKGARKGFTIVECMLAGGIIMLLVLTLFEGIIVATKISHENSELLAAEAIAWDAVWKVFNEPLVDINKRRAAGAISETLTETSAPELCRYDQSPVLKLWVDDLADDGYPELRYIEADVEWGRRGHRRKVSDAQRIFIYRGTMERTEDGGKKK